jgi:Protein of unknown function (DUF1761)
VEGGINVTVLLGSINWLAVTVATVVYFALGAVWFAPATPIGRAWMAASGYQSPTTGTESTNLFYIIPAATSFVAVAATALLAQATGTDSLNEGVLLGLVVGIGYAATIVLTTAAFEFSKPRQWTWGLVDASYHVVGLLIAAIIIALWH